MRLKSQPHRCLFAIAMLFAFIIPPSTGWTSSHEALLSKGQTVYVPVYSNVFSGPRSLPFQLATTLSIRNTDLSSSLRISGQGISFVSPGQVIREGAK